jgi:kynurenine formamidase
MTEEEETTRDADKVRRLARTYCNWGKWGPNDELGAMNFITPDKVRRAAQLVRTGRVISLALPLDSAGPMNGAFGRVNPIHTMLQDGGDITAGAQANLALLRYTDDAVYMPLQCSTQWDALSHIFLDGQMYNGWGPEHVTSSGAARNSIVAIKDRAVSRGVLLDFPRFLDKAWMEPGEPIQAGDLDACLTAQGVALEPGDFVLIRTGGLAQVRQQGYWGDAYSGGSAPGMALSCAGYLCPRHVAAVCTDTWGTEVRPNETPGVFQPLHLILLVSAGIYLGEMWDLEELATACARESRYDFMVVAPPLTITGAVGSPVNPQAIM